MKMYWKYKKWKKRKYVLKICSQEFKLQTISKHTSMHTQTTNKKYIFKTNQENE